MSEDTNFRELIDVWDADTFDQELSGSLKIYAELIRDYYITSRRQWLDRDASDHRMPYPENPHAEGFMRFTEHVVMPLMQKRVIRAWHYTRMTDAEVNLLRSGGVHLSNLASIGKRFAAMVAAGAFSQEVANRLFADSPFQSEQLGARSNKFWMVSHPLNVDSAGVQPLLESWGGESAYFWQRDPALQQLLKTLGRPRVLEVAMPLCYSRHTYSAAEAVMATYGQKTGARADRKVFDLYTSQPLGPEHILAVHSEGDAPFDALGRGYPDGYIGPSAD